MLSLPTGIDPPIRLIWQRDGMPAVGDQDLPSAEESERRWKKARVLSAPRTAARRVHGSARTRKTQVRAEGRSGHTHVQGHRVFDEGVVMNPGSVGPPRDGDPKAGYAVVELSDGSGGDAVTVAERRVAYDVDAVVDAVRAAGLPERIGTRLYEGK
jgi:hypothetical protein